MALEIESFSKDFDPRFKIFHELMARKVRDVLLVSTPYDAWILEEDCRLSERIINEYRGLNLSNPPRFTWVSSAQDALAMLDEKKFDMVITMSQLADMDVFTLGEEIKKKVPDLPVVLLAHDSLPPPARECPEFDSPTSLAIIMTRYTSNSSSPAWLNWPKIGHPASKIAQLADDFWA